MTEHFTRKEFEKGGAIPLKALDLLADFSQTILEPIRSKFGKPVHITSGHRSVKYNRKVGGASNSQHVYTREMCAADITIPGVLLQEVFDWIRLKSKLPFDQVILERGKQARHEADDCIHISYVRGPRRVALEGSTHGTGGYKKVEVKT